MAEMGPRSLLGRARCPSCGGMILVNRDGRMRHHRNAAEPRSWACPGSYQPAPGGGILVLKLKDGVVIKVRHAPGTFADDVVTDELVLLDAEWDELVKVVSMPAPPGSARA